MGNQAANEQDRAFTGPNVTRTDAPTATTGFQPIAVQQTGKMTAEPCECHQCTLARYEMFKAK